MKNYALRVLFLVSFIVVGNFVYSQTSDKTAAKSDPNVPIFEIKNDLGQTVFAVYPGGVKIFIDDQLKAAGGGFTVGRLSTGKAVSTDFFIVNPGDVRVNISDNALKAAGGGFTVGRLSTGKAVGIDDNFLKVTPDSTRIYTNEKSDKGFAVGKLSSTVPGGENFLDLTPQNYFIGHESGRRTTGTYNLFLGFRAGYSNTTGDRNFFAGYLSGIVNTTGFYNVFIGPESGLNNLEGNRNIFIGHLAGKSNVGVSTSGTIGHDNIYMGTRAGEANVNGEHNTLIGSYSGYTSSGTKNTFLGAFTGFAASGTANVFLGVDAGRNNEAGNNNVFLGAIAGNSNSGSNNTFVGYGSGYNNTAGNGNVFLGLYAGLNETGSNKLYIDNSSTTTPLIHGDFTLNNVTINGNLYYTGTIGAPSDLRLKTNLLQFTSGLEIVKSLNSYYFNWNNMAISAHGFSDKKQLGFIAQEVEKLLPEIVTTASNGYKAIDYSKMTPVLLEAIKEQNMLIQKLEEQVGKLEASNGYLKEKLDGMEQLKSDIKELKTLIKEMKEK